MRRATAPVTMSGTAEEEASDFIKNHKSQKSQKVLLKKSEVSKICMSFQFDFCQQTEEKLAKFPETI